MTRCQICAITEAQLKLAEAARDVYRSMLDRRFRAPIVCLCGSTRFGEAFREANLRETLAGRIVLSVGCDMHSDADLWLDEKEREAVKVRLDELHKRKIDLADEVLVLDVGCYIGASTRSEIEYAEACGKPIRYLSREIEDYVGSVSNR